MTSPRFVRNGMSTSTGGFTLIETLVYLAIFSLVIGGIVCATNLLLQSGGKVQTNAMLLQEEQFLMATFERAVGQSTSASVSSGVLSLSGSHTMRLNGTDLELNNVPLNNTNVRVTRALFTVSGSPVGVTADITLEANAPGGQLISYSASTTKYLRQ